MELNIVVKYSILKRFKADVLDSNGRLVYRLKGRFLSPTHVMKIYGADKKKLYKVRNKFFHIPFTRTSMIYNGNKERIAKIYQKFDMVNKYIVKECEDEIRIEGDFIGWNFEVFKNDEVIGKINAKISMFGNFIVDLDNENDAEFIVAIFGAINNLKHSKK